MDTISNYHQREGTHLMHQPAGDQELFAFVELYVLHYFVPHELDRQSGVPAGTVDRMLQNLPVPRDDAERVLKKLSLQVQKIYTLGNVQVNLSHEERQHSEEVRLKAQIHEEYEAAQQAMSGFALGTAQHRFINARMENMSRHLDTLHVVGGEEVFRQTLAELGEA